MIWTRKQVALFIVTAAPGLFLSYIGYLDLRKVRADKWIDVDALFTFGANPFLYYAIGGITGVLMSYFMKLMLPQEFRGIKNANRLLRIIPWSLLGIALGLICILTKDFLWGFTSLGIPPAMIAFSAERSRLS